MSSAEAMSRSMTITVRLRQPRVQIYSLRMLRWVGHRRDIGKTLWTSAIEMSSIPLKPTMTLALPTRRPAGIYHPRNQDEHREGSAYRVRPDERGWQTGHRRGMARRSAGIPRWSGLHRRSVGRDRFPTKSTRGQKSEKA